MIIGIFGATGVIGSRVATEARERGHVVHGFTRRAKTPDGRSFWQQADIRDVESTSAAIAPVDVVVNAISTGPSIGDFAEAIEHADDLPAAAETLLKVLERTPEKRLLTIGGAGSLEVAPGLQICDTEGFAESLPQTLGTPVEYHRVILAHREALNRLRLSNRNWTYLSPSADLITSGRRTGSYRTGTDQLLVAPNGTPAGISAEDIAVAVLDELEHPNFLQRRFTVSAVQG